VRPLSAHVLEPAAAAFLEVGVLVAPLLLAVSWVQWRTRGRWLARLTASRRAGPLAGAVLGATPGCGGAIALVPLWRRGEVSFGTVVAALVATMGDSSFVLIAASPRLALAVHALLLATGLVVGLLVDALGVAPRARSAAPAAGSAEEPVGPPAGSRWPGTSPGGAHGVHLLTTVLARAEPNSTTTREPGDLEPASTRGGACGRGTGRSLATPSLVAYWVLVVVGLILAIPLLTGGIDGPSLAPYAGGVDPVLVVGGAGVAVSLAIVVASRLRRRPTPASRSAPRRTLLVETSVETSVVTVWVAVAFALTAAATTVLDVPLLAGGPAVGPGAGEVTVGAGVVAVLAAAALGLVPGCGPQIVLTGLFVQGLVPFSVLAANALSQDGDALVPLLASDRRAAGLASVISTVPGVLVGLALHALGW
jgi:hypothetical protein